MAYPDEQNLTQLATLKNYLGGFSDSSQDSALTGLINRVSSGICRYISRDKLFSASYTEVRNGNGSSVMILTHRPVTAVASVTIGTVSIPLGTAGTCKWGYLFDDSAIYLIGHQFIKGAQNVRIVYTAGITANDPDMLILEQACILVCAQQWKRRDHIDEQSGSMNGIQTVSYKNEDFPKEVLTMLSNVKNVVPV